MMPEDGDEELASLGFLPPKMAAKLLPFQREGVKFAIGKRGRVLIGDEMGLGKTLQALAVAYYYKEEWPLLIVVPSSLRYPWVEEVEKWMPEINPCKIKLIASGTDIQDIGQADLCVVTYGLLRHPSCKIVQEALLNQKFKIIIVDESHYIKNRKAATTKFLVPLLKNAGRKILLTGTPALARPEELYPQLEALGHTDIFGNWSQYSKRYCDAHAEFFGRVRRWDTSGASNLPELQSKLRDHVMIRRLKRDVLKQLPPKQRQKVPFEVKDSNIKKEMDELWRQLHGVLGKGQTTINHVFDGALGTDEDSRFRVRCLMGELYRMTAKVKIGPVKEYVKMLCQNHGLKIIVFAHHHVMMDGIQEQLNDDKIKFIRIDGNTVQQERPALVHQYQTDAETRVAVLSMKAAGVGLTLTAAKLVVFAELDWTPGVLEQCEDRAHRIGQKETVHVHYLVGRWTLDDWVWTALCKKTVVVTTTLNGEKQQLQMDSANQGQISWLERADAWAPPPVISDDSLRDVFQESLTPSNQRSVLDYFKPNSQGGASPALEESKGKKGKKRKKSSWEEEEENVIELLGSDSDEENFNRNAKKCQRSEEVDLDTSLPDITWKRKKYDKKVVRSSKKQKCESSEVHEQGVSSGSPCGPRGERTEIEVDAKKHANCSVWSCQACTFLNNDMLPYCEMCSSPRPKPVRKSSRHRSKSPSDDADTAENNKKKKANPDTAESLGSVEKIPKFSQYVKRVTSRAEKAEDTKAGSSEQSAEQLSDTDRTSTACSSQCKDDLKLKTREYKSSFQPRKIILTAEEKPTNSGTSLAGSQSTHFRSKRKYSQMALSFLSAGSGSSEEEDNVVPIEKSERTEKELAWLMDKEESAKTIEESDADASDNVSNISQVSSELFDDDQCGNGASLIDSFSTDEDVKVNNRTIHDISDDETDDGAKNGGIPSDLNETGLEGGKRLLSQGSATSLASGATSSGSAWNTPKSKGALTAAALEAEEEAARLLFSPKRAVRVDLREWVCPKCDFENEAGAEDCDGCLETRPVEEKSGVTDRQVDLDKVPVYTLLKYRCSLNTARVYLYDEEGEPLNINFLPFDVEMNNFGELPDILLHPTNFNIVKRFVRAWSTLSPTKQNIVIRSGEIFANPVVLYDQIKGAKKISAERYTSKLVGAMAAFVAAEKTGGSVRVIKRPEMVAKKVKRKGAKGAKEGGPQDAEEGAVESALEKAVEGASSSVIEQVTASGKKKKGLQKRNVTKEASTSSLSNEVEELPWQDIEKMKGIVQAVDADGRPLCVHCQSPYSNGLLSEETVKKNPWITRFCSKPCTEEYWISRHREYAKSKLRSIEKGVCQLCHFDAQEFFNRIKTVKDLKKRASLIQDSKYSVLTAKVKEAMVKNPLSGQFWHMDHIVPVVDGGGECDIDNLRTLCSVCHQDVTKVQNKERRAYRKHLKNTQLGDITAFLQKK